MDHNFSCYCCQHACTLTWALVMLQNARNHELTKEKRSFESNGVSSERYLDLMYLK